MVRVASGPQNPWVSEACGSASISRTRRPSRARVPARWWHVDDLPTPPFWLSRVTTGTGSLPRGTDLLHRGALTVLSARPARVLHRGAAVSAPTVERSRTTPARGPTLPSSTPTPAPGP